MASPRLGLVVEDKLSELSCRHMHFNSYYYFIGYLCLSVLYFYRLTSVHNKEQNFIRLLKRNQAVQKRPMSKLDFLTQESAWVLHSEPNGNSSLMKQVCNLFNTVIMYASIASFPDLPAHPQTLYARLFFYPLKAGRSGRFGDVMMMSGGRGLARHGCGLEE